jgi:hypothetical protein
MPADVPDLNGMLKEHQPSVILLDRVEPSGGERASPGEPPKRHRLLLEPGVLLREPRRFDGEYLADASLEGLAARIVASEEKLRDDFTAGRIGAKYNTLQHRQRVLSQARRAYSDLLGAGAGRRFARAKSLAVGDRTCVTA